MTSSSGSGGEGGAQVKKKAGAAAEDDDSLMDFRPQRVLKADELSSVKTAVTAKLSDLMDEPCDEVFPEYITVMISNGKTIREICSQLEDLLTSGIATLFCKWLGKHLRGVETSSAKTSPQAKTTSSPDTTKSSKAKSHVPSKAEEGVGSGKGTGKEGGRSSGQAKKAKVVSSKVLTSSPGAVKGKGSRERSPSSSRSRSRSTFSSRSLDRDRSRGRNSRDRGRGSRARDWDRGRNDSRDWPRARVRNDRGRDHRDNAFNNRTGDRSRDNSNNNNMRDRASGTSYRVNTGGLDRYGPDPRDRDHHHRASPIRDRDSRDRFRPRNGSGSMERKESFPRERRAPFSKDNKESHPRDIRGESRDRGKRDHSRDRNRDHRDMEREKEKGFAALAQPSDAGRGKGLESEVDRVEGGGGGEGGEGPGGEQASRATVKSSVSVVASPRTEETKPTVQGSISVVGGSAKEEMDLQKEKAKLPDLRMIIQERRRAAEAAEKAVDVGEPAEAKEVHKLKGRGAEGRGNMRGFSPEREVPHAPAQAQNGKAGVKRGSGAERPPGARLLSSAMMQSVQSVGVRAPPLDIGAVAEGNGGGDKRRKSADGVRYVKITSSGKMLGEPVDDHKNNNRQMDDWARDEERNRAPAEGQRLRITNPSSLATPASHTHQHATTGVLQRTIDSTWQPWQSGGEEDDDDLEEADGEGSYLAYGGRGNAEHAEAEVRGGWDDARSQTNAEHVASPATAYFTAKQRTNNDSDMWTNNPDIQQNSEDVQGGNTPAAAGNGHGVSGTVRGNLTWTNPNLKRQQPHQQQGTHWADWAQSKQGNGKGSSPSEAVAKWATALRVAAAVNGTASPGANNALTVVSEESLALLASLSAEEAVAAAGFGAAQHMGTFGRGRGRAGRNATWVRGGQTARGRGRGRDSTAATGWVPAIGRGGGRVPRGGRGGRGRGIAVPVKSLGRGGGWHSTGTAVDRGAAGADVGDGEGEMEGGRGMGRGRGRGAGRLSERGVPRETWNKVWVRPDLVQRAEGGDAGGGGEKRAAGGDAPAVDE